MAVLAIGVVGAVAGGFLGSSAGLGFGIALGANIGFLAGSILGQILFPTPQVPHVFNPDVSASTYGAPIPMAWGTIRLPGNMIWSIPIQETAHSQNAFGKGALGGGSGQTTYTYACSFAFAFCKGPATDVLRMWADGKLVYDKNNIGSLTVNPDGTYTRNYLPYPNVIGTFRFYPGDENQIADSLIESYVGTGNESAHRGLCYIVFENIQLANYGNRIPSLTAEIQLTDSVQTIAIRFSKDTALADRLLSDNGELAYDRNRGLIYTSDTNGSNLGGGFRIFTDLTLAETRENLDSPAVAYIGLGVGDSGYIYKTIYYGVEQTGSGLSTAHYAIYKFDPNTLKSVADTGSISDVYGVTFDGHVEIYNDSGTYLVSKPNNGVEKLLVLNTASMAAIGFNDFGDTYLIVDGCAGLKGSGVSYHVRQRHADQSDFKIAKTTVAIDGTVTIADVATIASTGIWGTDGGYLTACALDSSDGSLIVWLTDNETGVYVLKWSETLGVVWHSHVIHTINNGWGTAGNNNTTITNQRVGWTDLGFDNSVALLDTSDGSILMDGVLLSSVVNGSALVSYGMHSFFYDGSSNSLILTLQLGYMSSNPALAQIFFQNVGANVTVENVVEDVSAVVGLDKTADIDATTLTDVIRGYGVVQQATAAGAINLLAGLFFFDGVETDGKIKFVKRGQSASFAHVQDNLVVPSNMEDGVVIETRAQEVDLPERLAIAYMDYDQDYQKGTAPARRTREPTPTMRSKDTQTIEVPIVFSASQDSPIAITEKMLFTIWNERTSYAWRAPFDALTIDPSDVGTITLDDASVLDVRVTKATINADLTTNLEAVKQSAFTNVSTTTGQGNLGYPQRLPPASNATILFALDIPLLRDVDDTAGTSDRLYIGMNGLQAGWRGGTLWDSPDNATFTTTGVTLGVGTAYGTVQTALPDTSTPWQTDYTNTIQVYMGQGSLASATWSEFINGANVAVIGSPSLQNWEIILFQNAVQQTDGSYVLSNILRGRRGTEFRTGTHVTGETAIFVTRATLTSYLLSLGVIGATRYYKGVGLNQLPEDATVVKLASTGAPMKPWTVTKVAAALSGSDVVITWNRRNRLFSDALLPALPLSEATESYQIDILSGHLGTVKRTLTATSETVTYHAADITTDFGSLPATLYFKVYQMSAVVGRGYSVENGIAV